MRYAERMNGERDFEMKDPPTWAVVLTGLVFLSVFLLWAIGFDWLADVLAGTTVEQVLNWLAKFWLHAALVMVGLGLLVGRLMRS